MIYLYLLDAGAVIWIACFMVELQLVHCYEETLKENFKLHNYKPKWVYRCIPDEGCLRTQYSQVTSILNSFNRTFKSLDVCQTVCGQFGSLWPKPVTATISMQTVKIHPNQLRFDLTNVPDVARKLMDQMTQLVGPNLMAKCGDNITEMVGTLVIVYISVKTPFMILDWKTDEKYILDVQTKGETKAVHIVAQTVFGARHALETFTQLVAADRPDYSDQAQCGLLLVASAKIRDHPIYKYRGLMLDCSRHFIPMKDIKRTIRGMSAVKMNVFHWHVTDSHSFPLESTRVPQFTRYGAYSPEELYSTEEVRELIQFARVRGVRVVIEIDSPAHAGNGWQWGQKYDLGELAVCVNAKPWRLHCSQPPCGQLNPANPAMYEVLKDLYKDIADLMTQPVLLHVGGDEVNFECWKKSQEIVTYMKQNGHPTSVEGFIGLWAEFHMKALQAWDEVVKATGSTVQPVMIWSSELTQAERILDHLNKDRYVIEVREPLSSPHLMELLDLGYRTVSVPKDIWYLDHGFWGSTKYSNWRRMYSLKLPRLGEMLGGEVAMWTEYVDDLGLDTRVWPRAAAVAERLWSDPRTSADRAEPRLQRLRRQLITRGLRPDAMSPAWCEQHASWYI